MRTLRDFVCDDCGKEQERFIDTDITTLPCDCGGNANRIIGMPRVALDGTDPGFPGAYDKWARTWEDNAKVKAKKSWAE